MGDGVGTWARGPLQASEYVAQRTTPISPPWLLRSSTDDVSYSGYNGTEYVLSSAKAELGLSPIALVKTWLGQKLVVMVLKLVVVSMPC